MIWGPKQPIDGVCASIFKFSEGRRLFWVVRGEKKIRGRGNEGLENWLGEGNGEHRGGE